MKTNRIKSELRHPKGLDITDREIKNLLIQQASEVFSGLITENPDLYSLLTSHEKNETHHIMLIEIRPNCSVLPYYNWIRMKDNWFKRLLMYLYEK